MKQLCFLLSFYILNVYSGSISIVASLGVNKNESQFFLAGYLHNRGNETAKDLKMFSSELVQPINLFTQLGPNEKKNFYIPFNQLENFTKGRTGFHILSFILTYKDLNGVDFSAPVLTSYQNGTPASFNVSISKANELLQFEKEIIEKFTFKNYSEKKVKLILKHITSRELKVDSIEDIELDAGEEEQVEVELENQNGLVGSSYYYFLVVENYEGDKVYSELVTQSIYIKKEEPFSFSIKEEVPFLFILILIGLLIFIGVDESKKLERIQD